MMIVKWTRELRKYASGLSLLIALAGFCILGQTQTAQAQAAACPPGQDCPCTWTAWLDRDQPGATGDWELLSDFVKAGQACKQPMAVQCRYKGGAVWGSQAYGGSLVNTAGAGYTCNITIGGRCINNNTKPKGSCKNSEVRFCCAK